MEGILGIIISIFILLVFVYGLGQGFGEAIGYALVTEFVGAIAIASGQG